MTKINCPECKHSHVFNLENNGKQFTCKDHGEKVPESGMMKCHKCKEPFNYELVVSVTGKTRKIAYAL